LKSKSRIAIVDDEEDLCFLLSSFLQGMGFEVESFHSISQYRDQARAFNPDWAIIDNNLPDGSGWDLARSIREEFPELKLILISANPDAPRAGDARSHYLVKPIGFTHIASLISA
jgi:DNA-binding response OmpR family regulator